MALKFLSEVSGLILICSTIFYILVPQPITTIIFAVTCILFLTATVFSKN
ncbi:hypothetical protein HNP81_002058 [Peribacillus huizhouensis]|uniref:Uncharacterized protein n=1 Tax=Peribacillus huizhouensis TaxID=1501239 RepID=A0ABR6CQ45_9BACI|nr:hypothetical protein [Peribacillus huizhouensis]